MPAPWITLADLPADRPQAVDAALWQRAIDSATAVLSALTGGRWVGRRERTVDVWAPPALTDPCAGPRRLRLPDRAVVELLSVATAAGTEQPLDPYRLAPGGWLEVLPGRSALMPTPSTPLRLRYIVGRNAPADARTAATHLAVELGRTEVDPEASALPDSVTSITRQGVTMTYETAGRVFADGRTGVPAVDLWLATVSARRPPRTWSPDTEAPYRIVATLEAP